MRKLIEEINKTRYTKDNWRTVTALDFNPFFYKTMDEELLLMGGSISDESRKRGF